VVELQRDQKAGERSWCRAAGWLPGVVTTGHRLIKSFTLAGPPEGCWSHRALAAGPGSVLDPASKLGLVAQGPDFSKQPQTTGSSVGTGPATVYSDFDLLAGRL